MLNTETIRKWWNTFVGEGNFTEVRILGKFGYSGYFKSLDNLLAQIEPYSKMDEEQIYFVLNKINDACYGRQQSEKFIKSPKITTNDSDIVARRVVLIDFDPVRATGVNASDDEFELAHKKAQDVFVYLRAKGFNDPVICKSGNGWHLQYKIDTPNDEETTEIIKGFLKSLGNMFTDEKVDIDEKVYNAARICKLYGTMAKKGANIPERPWRESSIVYVPKEYKVTPIEKFKEIADLLPKEEPRQLPNRSQYNNMPFNLVSWLTEHGISYKEQQKGSSTMYVLEECPWIDTHSDRKKWDSALFVDAQGKITFNCHHSHCKDKTWQDVRLHYEPNAYDRPTYQPMYFQQRVYVPQKPILKKDEFDTSKEGVERRWKSMTEIKRVNLMDIPHFLTGYIDLDKAIKGLFDGEVTIISGLNSSGKSSWLNSLILNIIEQGVRVAMWSGELQGFVLKSWLHMVAAGKTFLKPYDDYWYVPEPIAQRIDAWLSDRLLLFDNDYPPEWSLLLNDMEVLAEQGVRLFVLDNLMSMNIDIVNGSDNQKQTALIKNVCNMAKQYKCHIILVAHPRKATGFLRKTDISGTSDLTNAASNVLIVHRVNNDFKKLGGEFFGDAYISQFNGFGNVVEVCKNRLMGAQDTLVGLHYEQESRRFKNSLDETIHYGWEEIATQQTIDFVPKVEVPMPNEPERSEEDRLNDALFGGLDNNDDVF